MPWNLVSSFPVTKGSHEFCLPLNELSTDSVVDFTETEPKDRIDDAVLRIHIQPPAGGFQDTLEMPTPSLRLHAMGSGRITFGPANSTHQDRLVLTLYLLFTSIFREAPNLLPAFPKWWDRWRDTMSIPIRVIYENVDRDSVRSALQLIKAPIDEKRENRIPIAENLRFPDGVFDGISKTLFIDSFMQGNDGYFIEVSPGAYLGKAGKDPDDQLGAHLLALHVEYAGHSKERPHPMNPREFLYLLFGDDSEEAQSHPLLLKLNDKGSMQAGHQSKSMRLRPPLRTHARVMWESGVEEVYGAEAWAPGQSCEDRFYNDHERQGRRFDNGAYTSSWKCNLFVFDVAVRSGFRIKIHSVGSDLWHYGDPEWIAKKIDGVKNVDNSGSGRVAVAGKVGAEKVVWCYKIEGLLRAQPGSTVDMATVRDLLNAAMHEEGRCIIYVLDYTSSTGHMGLVESVFYDTTSHPLSLAGVGHGFSQLYVASREATHRGAEAKSLREWSAGGGISIIHMFELSPGRDPDTPSGLQDCNVEA